jgi:DNA-binding transcriptional ArsR family regulator
VISEKWAKVPQSVIESGLSNGAFRLYCHLDRVQGANGRPAKGYGAVGRTLGMRRQTVTNHARELVDAGLVSLEQDQSDPPTSGKRAVSMRVIHNPSRTRLNPLARLNDHEKETQQPPRGSGAPQTFDGVHSGHPTNDHRTERMPQRSTQNALLSRSKRSEQGVVSAPTGTTGREEADAIAALCARCGGVAALPPNPTDEDYEKWCSCEF